MTGTEIFPSKLSVDSGRIAARELLGQVAACLYYKLAAGCAGLLIGALWSEGFDFDDAHSDVSAAAAVFFRLGLDVPIGPKTAVRFYADLTAPVRRQRYLESGTDAVFWESSPVGAVWGAAFLFTFFDGTGTATTI